MGCGSGFGCSRRILLVKGAQATASPEGEEVGATPALAFWVEAIGGRRMFELRPNQPVRLVPLSQTEFSISGRYGNRIGFLMNHGKATVAVLNPGRWAQRGLRTD